MKNKLYTIEQGLEYAKNYCAKQERCQKEVVNKLISLGLNSNESEEIVVQLICDNYINEQRYTDLYVKSKINQNHWGRIKIKYMLKGKGISEQCINNSFANINEEKYKQTVQYLFDKKLAVLHTNNNYERKNKLRYFISSHGFENDIIEEIFKENNLL